MSHYLEIYSIDKEKVKGIAVLSFSDNEPFKDHMTELLSVTRCSFNNVFRRYFNVNSEWDADYFVIKAEHLRDVINELKHEHAQGEESEIYDQEDYDTVMGFLVEHSANKDPDATYLITWEK